MQFLQSFRLLSVALICSVAVAAQGQTDMVGKAAPAFVRSDLNRRQVDINEYRGKIVLLNFWATWCTTCQIELPEFEAWQKKYGEDILKVITVSMDDSDVPVRKIVRRLHLDLPVVMGEPKLGQAYGGILGLPVTFLIDREGKIAAQFKGETDPRRIEADVKRLLSSPL